MTSSEIIFFVVVFALILRWVFKKSEPSVKPGMTLELKQNKEAEPYCLVFDVETTGLIKDKLRPTKSNLQEYNDNFPYIVSIAWALLSRNKEVISEGDFLVNPEIEIPQKAIDIHGITNEKVKAEGKDIKEVLQKFARDAERCKAIVGHNVMFDKHVVEAEFVRNNMKKPFTKKKAYCTMKMGKLVMRQGKPPRLDELCVHFYGNGITPHLNSHSSLYDTFFTAHCFFSMKNKRGYYWSK